VSLYSQNRSSSAQRIVEGGVLRKTNLAYRGLAAQIGSNTESKNQSYEKSKKKIKMTIPHFFSEYLSVLRDINRG